MIKKSNEKRQRVIYRPSPNISDVPVEDTLYYVVICPICKKRTIDVSPLPENTITLRYKCQHCRNIIKVPLTIQRKNCV